MISRPIPDATWQKPHPYVVSLLLVSIRHAKIAVAMPFGAVGDTSLYGQFSWTFPTISTISRQSTVESFPTRTGPFNCLPRRIYVMVLLLRYLLAGMKGRKYEHQIENRLRCKVQKDFDDLNEPYLSDFKAAIEADDAESILCPKKLE
jgi:hypothetical protein